MDEYQEIFKEAKKQGYSDEEITNYLLENDPDFGEIISQSKEAGHSPEDVLNYFNSSSTEKQEGAFEHYSKDILKQGTQGFGIGSLGTYGDVLDLLGIQSKETLPGEKAQYGREANILQGVQEGKNPSVGELLELSDDDISPRFSRLPSSEDIEEGGKKIGLISEPKTAAGRYARRIGKIGGGGASLGGGGIASPIAAGIAGQTLEELGAPPWAQAAAEIIAGLKFAPKTKIPITSKSKEVEKVITDLRKAGYAEKDITMAKNALEEHKILKKYATLTPEAENSIRQGVKNSEVLFKDQIEKGLPGYADGGIPYLEEQASNVYQSMEELASSVSVRNKEPFRQSIQKSIDYMEKSALLPEEKEFIEFLKDGLQKVSTTDTADFMTSFYRKLGKAGKWTDPSTKEHLLSLVKNGVKKSFAESGPEAAKFGKYFDKTNDVWKNWLDTRNLMQTIEKAQSVDGMNFKKLTSVLNDPKNRELAKKVLGPEQLNNIDSINKGAQAIESLLKQIPQADKTSKAIKLLEGVRALITGDVRTLAVIIGLESAKRLARQLLLDPKKQNQMKKLITAAKNNSGQQAAILAQELVKKDDAQAKEGEESHR